MAQKKCDCKQIERRIRKNARLEKMFSKGDKIVVVGEVCEYFVKSIVGGMPTDIKVVKKIPAKVSGKVVVPYTADDKINEFFSSVFNGRKIVGKKYVELLGCITDEEAQCFAECKGLKFKPLSKDKGIMEIVDAMQKKYSETKFSLVNSVNEVSGL